LHVVAVQQAPALHELKPEQFTEQSVPLHDTAPAHAPRFVHVMFVVPVAVPVTA
jgi:hypothetical protein